MVKMDGDQRAPANKTLNKKRKFIEDGVFKAELNHFLSRILAQEGYAGIDVLATASMTEVIINATRIKEVLGTNGYRIRELSSLIQKRFNYPKDSFTLLAKKVNNRGLSAAAQAESLRYKLLAGFPVRMAANGVVKFVMHNGAKGVEVVVSGKLRAQRAKSMKYKDGYMISAGHPRNVFIDEAVRHVEMKQGILGVKVKIMLPHDSTGALGPSKPLPDFVDVLEPKAD